MNEKQKFAAELVRVALGQVGTREVGRNGGKAVRAYQSATWLEPGEWPWCAAFVCWCLLAVSVKFPNLFVMPRTPAAFKFETWGRNHAKLLHSPAEILPGDIVIFEFSHIGIAVAKSSAGAVDVVEGNTNPAGSREGDGVYLRNRSLSLVRSIVRLTV